MEFDRFDVCAAYNVFSQLWGWDAYTHGIQVRLSRIAYRPSNSEQTLGGLSYNAREIYAALVARKFPTESSYVPCACCGVDVVGTVVVGGKSNVPVGTDLCEECSHAECSCDGDEPCKAETEGQG